MTIDKADWHYESAEKAYLKKMNLPDDYQLSDEQIDEVWLYAADHIGLFIKWIIDNDFENKDSDEIDSEGVNLVREGKISGSRYIMDYCDGKLWDVDLCEEIIPFVKYYYAEGNLLFCDLKKAFPESIAYGRISDEKDYLKISTLINQSYKEYNQIQNENNQKKSKNLIKKLFKNRQPKLK